MPAIVFCVDSVQDKSVIDNDGTKILFGLTVIEGLSILSDFVQECLPFVDVFTKLIVNLLRIDDPQSFIVKPNFYIILCILKNGEYLFVSELQSLW